jgi:hypothetical protein
VFYAYPVSADPASDDTFFSFDDREAEFFSAPKTGAWVTAWPMNKRWKHYKLALEGIVDVAFHIGGLRGRNEVDKKSI